MSTGSIPIPVEVVGGADTLATLLRIANALESTGKSASEADPKVKTLGERFAGLGTAARHFNEVAEFAGRMSSAIMGAAERIGELAAEQSRLDRVSAQTGLNLDEAAAAAGRFADETEAASVAGRLFQAGTRMTQEQLNALMRVAGAASHTLGVDTAEAVNRLTDGLLSGSQRALRPFGADLAAAGGESHTMADRLGALVTQANHTTTAVDDAHDSVKRFQDAIEDSQRTVAAAFATEFARLSSLGTDMNSAADGAEEFNRNLQAVGQTAAGIVAGIANGIGVIIGFIGTAMGTMVASVAAAGSAVGALASGNFRGAGAAARRTFAEYTGPDSVTGQMGQFTTDRARALNAMADDSLDPRTSLRPTTPARPAAPPRPERPSGGGRGGGDRYEELRARIEGEDAVIQEDRRLRVERRDAEERFAKARAQEEQRAADRRLELERAMRERANDNDAEAGDRAYQRSDRGVRDRAQKDRDNAREARDLDHRYQQHRGFTERMEELSHRRIYAAQEEADAINGAFGAMGRAFSDHLMAVVEGREELGTALQGMLSDTLLTIAKESSVKAGLNLAEGFAALATYRYDAAAEHFAAAGIYTGVAVAAGVAGAAIAPAAPDKGAAAAQRQSASPQGSAPSQGGGGTVINVAFNGPQFGTGGVVQAARELAGVLNSGAVQGGVQINRLAVAGMGGR